MNEDFLTRFFAAADYDIARLCAWTQRRGAAVLILYAAIAAGLYSLVDCAIYVWRYTR